MLKASTLERRLASISAAHRAAGYGGISVRDEPIRSVWAGIRRTKGTAPAQKAAIRVEDLRRMVEALSDTIQGLRDRALLLVGFAGAFRRSELVSLDVEDVEQVSQGLIIRIRRSKTDQEGQGRIVGIPYGSREITCPVRSYQAWLQASGIASGAIFRPIDRHGNVQASRLSDRAVAMIVKRAAAAAGLDPTRYSGHSLRAGLATAAAAAGVEERLIMAQTGHRSEKMVRRYIREGELFRRNAAAFLDL
ncbi:MAG: site-specific integrase [Alicyclobacillaceae bacterium]|nr:site-specific integrase [Alicyclobacillaceae bacterium]